MKKYIIILFGFLLLTTIIEPVAASAIDSAQSALGEIAKEVGITLDPDPQKGVAQLVGGFIKVMLSILGVVFMGLTVYGGWLWMTAAGNQERVTKAKDLLRNSVIGIIIVVTAYAITFFVVRSVVITTIGGVL